MFGKMNVIKTKESLIVRNEIIDKLEKEFGFKFDYGYNDLYGVKGGVVRRLKGGLISSEMNGRSFWNMDRKEFNELFNKVKGFIENLEFEGFKVEFNKRIDYSWFEYKRLKDNGFEGNFLDYKEESLCYERTLILKIGWNV